ncbi:MAG: T9SS type A sorting domain-containing protein [Bacteroidales bacterium]|nr:Omp28-related outer membrane protein [Lentimicrobiaceae bacterium]MDD5695914.1 T9SS type A sorting domain-containing protein [Bacteroidales bacterium]
MKKYFLLIPGLLLTLMISAQQVDRDKVIVEIATGTWCQFCPGAAKGADDLITNGKEVAIIEYHGGDEFENTASASRINYYNITGYPTAVFDGTLKVEGGDHTASMYSYYLPKYNQRIAIPSSFTIGVEGENTCFINYSVTVTVNKVADATGTFKLHAAVTESDLQVNWQGMSELDYVERMMVPSQSGTPIDFTFSNTQVVNLLFTVNADWVRENCELTVFLQNTSTKEILQGVKMNLTDFPTTTQVDAALLDIQNVSEVNCSGTVAPTVTIRNNGQNSLSSLEIDYQVNGMGEGQYNWTGSLSQGQTEAVELPAISFPLDDQNTLEIQCSHPNNSTDECPDNDAVSASFTDNALQATGTIYLVYRLDNHPEETSWELRDQTGEVLFSDGPFPGMPGLFVTDTLALPGDQCYDFIIYDSGGNGICCTYGIGLYSLKDSEGIVLAQGGNFGYSEMTTFEVAGGVGMPENTAGGTVHVYPNPANDQATVNITLSEPGRVTLRICTLAGDLITVYEKGFLAGGEHQIILDTKYLPAGVYFLEIMTEGMTGNQKLVILK